jgi:hypothetical protein
MKFKLTGLLLYLLLAATLSIAQTQKVSISASNLPIKTVFDQLQFKSKYYILYSDEVVPDSMKVSVQADNVSINTVMDQLLSGKNLGYHITGKGMIVISAKTSSSIATHKNEASTELSGTVYNQNIALPFVSVTLIKNGKIVSGCISNNDGSFSFGYPFLTGEAYQLKVSTIGYQAYQKEFVYPDTSFAQKISLVAETRTLNTVNVVAQRPLVTRKADRYIVNVEGSFLENGFSGLEVLQRSPGIWVNNDGSIRTKGNQSVMVMINDVVQRMSTDDLAQYLRALKSESISKIEVISNPPSEFEASGTGGIIHIQLKKSRSDGMVTSLNAQYRQQQKRPFFSTGGLVDYKTGNFYLFGNAFATSDESAYIATYHIIYPDNSLYDSFTNRYNHNQRVQYRLGMAYDLDKNQSISVQTIGSTSKLEQSFLTDVKFNSTTGFTNSRWLRRPDQSSSTFNYIWKIDSLGSMLKVIGDYAYSHKTELNQFEGNFSDASRNSLFRVNTPNTTGIYSFQTDYTKALAKKTEVKTGIKFASTDRDNELINEDYINNSWVLDQAASNHFLYNEKLYMAYASFEKTAKNTSLKIGFRGEETRVGGNSVTSNQQFSKNYFGLFPSFFINHAFDPKQNQSVHFSYSRRLQRPAYRELNPYRLQIDNFLVTVGNPDLQPQYTHNFELGLDLKQGYSVNVYFAHTSNAIAQFAQPIQNNILEYQFRNFSNSTDYGGNINIPIKIASWWNVNNSAALFRQSYLLLNDQRNTQVTFSAKTAHSLTFKNLFDVSIYYEYRSPYVSGNTRFHNVTFSELGFSRKFLKDNKGRIQLYFDDIFNTFREQETTNYNNTQIYFYQKRPTQTASIQFSYTITSGKKFTNKKVDQSNGEEKNRL